MSELSELGFPEFESIHLHDFSSKAQFPKSVASTIPPRPLIGLGNTLPHNSGGMGSDDYGILEFKGPGGLSARCNR